MKYIFNPFTSTFDITDNDFGKGGIYIIDANGREWRLTIDRTGALITT